MTVTATALKAVGGFAAVEKKERIHRRVEPHEEDFDELLGNSKKRKRKKNEQREPLLTFPSGSPDAFSPFLISATPSETADGASKVYQCISSKSGEKVDIVR